MNRTVTAHFTRAIFKASGMPLEVLTKDVQLWLSNGCKDDRIPLSTVDKIWKTCVDYSNDELFGIRAGLNIQIGDLDVVGYMLMSSDTIEEAIKTIIDFHHIIGEGGDFNFLVENDVCRLSYTDKFVVCANQRMYAVVGSTVALAKILTNGEFTLSQIQLPFSVSSCSIDNESRNLLGCEILYDAQETTMLFPANMLSTPVTQSNSQVFKRMRALGNETLEKLVSSSLSHTVTGLIRENPTFSKDQIARQLHISARHLTRKLSAEKTSFKLLQDKTKVEIAKKQLREKQHPSAIAEHLGLSDERSFSKAFKRWSGTTPSQFLASQK